MLYEEHSTLAHRASAVEQTFKQRYPNSLFVWQFNQQWMDNYFPVHKKENITKDHKLEQ